MTSGPFFLTAITATHPISGPKRPKTHTLVSIKRECQEPAPPVYSLDSNSAFLNFSTLQFSFTARCTIVETGGRLGLDLDGDLHLHARAHGELLDDLVDQVGELLLCQERVQLDAAVELLLDRLPRSGAARGVAALG